MKSEQPTLVDFEEEPNNAVDSNKEMFRLENEILTELSRKYKRPGIFLKPTQKIKTKQRVMPDELRRYKIDLGTEENWNFEEFMTQNTFSDAYIDLYPQGGRERKANFLFSATRDAYDVLQSEHCYLSGMMGMGKTNLCSLMITQFPKRPNPTTSLWVAQKSSTALKDFPRMGEALDEHGYPWTKITFDEEYDGGRLPIGILHKDDIPKLLKLTPTDERRFESIASTYQKVPNGVALALGEFVSTEQGLKYANLYDSLINGSVFALKKKDTFKFRPHETVFMDISYLLNTQTTHVADIIVNGWVNYLYQHTAKKRKEASELYSEDEDYFKHQWQGMVVFDEFYELTNTYQFDRLMRTIPRIATQGRQEGTSLILASQTVAYSGKTMKVPLSQAAHIFQFKSSSAPDRGFVMRSMGWEDSQYKPMVNEIFDQVFPPNSDKDANKGRIILFSKDTNKIAAIRLKLLGEDASP